MKIKQGETRTEAEIVADFLAGHRVVMAEYRLNKAETIAYTDRKTDAQETFDSCRHTVETVDGAVTVFERTEKGFNASAYVSPFKKGERVAVYFSKWDNSKGSEKVYGEIVHVAVKAPASRA